MREIKFRAWDKHNHIFYKQKNPPFRMTYFANPVVYDDGWLQFEAIGQPPIGDAGKDRFEIMQYTGLQDKTGRDIFEGDIIQWVNWSNNESKLITIIEYEDDYAAFFFGNWYERSFPETSEEALIIGNIYENPELLTKD